VRMCVCVYIHVYVFLVVLIWLCQRQHVCVWCRDFMGIDNLLWTHTHTQLTSICALLRVSTTRYVCVCVCVCVCVFASLFLYVCVFACVLFVSMYALRMCVCVCCCISKRGCSHLLLCFDFLNACKSCSIDLDAFSDAIQGYENYRQQHYDNRYYNQRNQVRVCLCECVFACKRVCVVCVCLRVWAFAHTCSHLCINVQFFTFLVHSIL
jgi:hypothetical protein